MYHLEKANLGTNALSWKFRSKNVGGSTEVDLLLEGNEATSGRRLTTGGNPHLDTRINGEGSQ